MSLFVSFLVALIMAGGGFLKKSLNLSGAIAAFFVGIVTFHSSVRAGITLIVFFVSSSVITRLGKKRKRQVEGEHFQEGGQRSWVQVISNAPATLLCIALYFVDEGGNP